MSEMVERIAMAMAAELKRQTDEPDALGAAFFNMDGRLDDVIADGVFDLRTLARAAVTAMREPTDDEQDTAWGTSVYGEELNDWQAMIDEALK